MTIRISRRSALVVLVAVLLVLPSIALGTHVFDDVSDGSTHAPGIEWLAGTGVTAGCGGNDYCPGDPVTRAQMATFMHRLSGNAPGIAPSVDAASVGGYGADTFQHRFAESIAFGSSAVLAENGPLTVFANCILDDGGSDYLKIFVESSASGSYWASTALTANVAQEIYSVSVTTGDLYNSVAAALPLLVASSGETLNFDLYQHAIMNGGGYDCFITGSTETN